jgi:hypothetical protein
LLIERSKIALGRQLPAALKRVRFVDDPGLDTLRTFAIWRHDLGFDRAEPDLNGLCDTSALQRASRADR